MQPNNHHQNRHYQSKKVVCVTGGAKRIGKAIVQAFHENGFDVIIHYHQSKTEALELANSCNQIRPNSAKCVNANLENAHELAKFCDDVMACFSRIDVLVHNASRFYPTVFGKICDKDWHNLMSSNAQAPLFLSQFFAKNLQQTNGAIVSILDIHANSRPFLGYTVYNMAKSAHQMLVQSLALELAPHVRVNGVAPGVNILPEHDTEQALSECQIASICQSIPLQSIGTPKDIADAVIFLASANYITGQILAIDGGRSLTMAGS